MRARAVVMGRVKCGSTKAHGRDIDGQPVVTERRHNCGLLFLGCQACAIENFETTYPCESDPSPAYADVF